MPRHPPLVLAGLLALACSPTFPAGSVTGGGQPRGCSADTACEAGESCIDGACVPSSEVTLALEVDCPPALGAGEVVFLADNRLQVVPKAGGTVRPLSFATSEAPCDPLRVDGDHAFRFVNDPWEGTGWLYAHPITSGGVRSLSADDRHVDAAVPVGDRIFVAVTGPGELFSISPDGPLTPRTLLTGGSYYDLARSGDTLVVYERGDADQGTVFRLTPDGTRGPTLASGHGRARLVANAAGDVLLIDGTCSGAGGGRPLRLLRAGAAAFEEAFEVACGAFFGAFDETHVYLRPGYVDRDQRLERRPLSGGAATRLEGTENLLPFGVDEAWLYATRRGDLVRLPK